MASGNFSTALGDFAAATGLQSTAVGDVASALATNASAFGRNANVNAAATNGTALGGETVSGGVNSTAVGWRATATGTSSTALGDRAVASGNFSTALGDFAAATGLQSTAVGDAASALGINSTRVGRDANATALATVAIGNGSDASDEDAVAIGDLAQATGFHSTAVGGESVASGRGAQAFGWQSAATGDTSVAIGRQAQATGTNSTALGDNARATFANSTAIGAGATATAANQVTLGAAGTTVRLGGYTTAGVIVNDANGVLSTNTTLIPQVATNTANIGTLQTNVSALQTLTATHTTQISDLFDLSDINRRDIRKANEGVAWRGDGDAAPSGRNQMGVAADGYYQNRLPERRRSPPGSATTRRSRRPRPRLRQREIALAPASRLRGKSTPASEGRVGVHHPAGFFAGCLAAAASRSPPGPVLAPSQSGGVPDPTSQQADWSPWRPSTMPIRPAILPSCASWVASFKAGNSARHWATSSDAEEPEGRSRLHACGRADPPTPGHRAGRDTRIRGSFPRRPPRSLLTPFRTSRTMEIFGIAVAPIAPATPQSGSPGVEKQPKKRRYYNFPTFKFIRQEIPMNRTNMPTPLRSGLDPSGLPASRGRRRGKPARHHSGRRRRQQAPKPQQA